MGIMVDERKLIGAHPCDNILLTLLRLNIFSNTSPND